VTDSRTQVEAAYRARTARSATLHHEALRVFPGGVTRSITFYPPYPVYLAEGCGCRVTDVDGNSYLDALNNYGSMIHGHAHPAVVAALQQQVTRGTDWGTPTALHLDMAKALVSRVRSLEQVRLTNSGTEAVLYAIRAARAFTGRSAILKMEGSYHGGYDSVSVSVNPGTDAPAPPAGKAGSAGLAAGTVAETLVAPFNDLAAVERIVRAHGRRLAAIIVEPVMVRGLIAADAAFLRGLRELATGAGALLILDEVVTFRLGLGGMQQRVGVAPDLTTFGKIIGGGLPVGAFGGRADVMAGFDPAATDPVHHSGTFAGNAATIAAGLAALAEYQAPAVERVNALGDRLRSALESVLREARVRGQVTGVGSLVGLHFSGEPVRDYRSALRADKDAMRWFHLALLNAGVMMRASGGFFLSTAMTGADMDTIVAAVRAALKEAA
jgi:glutamate-1-semialdehyde 2,1-aminomutase